jgi:hypothetical protein
MLCPKYLHEYRYDASTESTQLRLNDTQSGGISSNEPLFKTISIFYFFEGKVRKKENDVCFLSIFSIKVRTFDITKIFDVRNFLQKTDYSFDQSG